MRCELPRPVTIKLHPPKYTAWCWGSYLHLYNYIHNLQPTVNVDTYKLHTATKWKLMWSKSWAEILILSLLWSSLHKWRKLDISGSSKYRFSNLNNIKGSYLFCWCWPRRSPTCLSYTGFVVSARTETTDTILDIYIMQIWGRKLFKAIFSFTIWIKSVLLLLSHTNLWTPVSYINCWPILRICGAALL